MGENPISFTHSEQDIVSRTPKGQWEAATHRKRQRAAHGTSLRRRKRERAAEGKRVWTRERVGTWLWPWPQLRRSVNGSRSCARRKRLRRRAANRYDFLGTRTVSWGPVKITCLAVCLNTWSEKPSDSPPLNRHNPKNFFSSKTHSLHSTCSD